jgi:hypothetical protein
MAVGPSFRVRRWAAARGASSERLGSPWGVASRVVVPVVAAGVSYAVIAWTEQRAFSVLAVVAALLGALVSVGLWSLVVIAYSYLAAPASMEHALTTKQGQAIADRDAKIRALTAERDTARATLAHYQNPQEQIRIVNQHISHGQAISGHLKAVARNRLATEQEWTLILKDEMDWLHSAGQLIESLCVGKKHDFDTLWRAVPSDVRVAGSNPDGSPYVDGRRYRPRAWVAAGVQVLLECIDRIDRPPAR